MLPVEKGFPGRGACPNVTAKSWKRPAAPSASPDVEVVRELVDFRPDRFWHLSPSGHQLIMDWAGRAERTLARAASGDPDSAGSGRRSQDTFEAFIYAWISFNGWASCCCDDHRDRALIDVVKTDARVSAEFRSLVRSNSTAALALEKFRSLWPIFQASEVRIGHEVAESEYRFGGRAALVAYYSHSFRDAKRAPDCHLRHDQKPIDADWAHTLEALYRVRNNLFHGTKSVHEQVDREVVDTASAVLVPVVNHMVSASFR